MAIKKLDYNGLQTLVTAFKDYVRKHAGMPVGHEYFSVNPNIPEGSLPLFGGEYSRETYSDLWSWVQTQTGYLKTEVEWQELYAAHLGNVPFYSDGDGSTTFRVPSLKCWVRGANGTFSEVGSYLEAGLPNITGGSNVGEFWVATPYYYTYDQGALKLEGGGSNNRTIPNTPAYYGYNDAKLSFDASHSNPIYGNADTVVPESIVGLWLVKAYGTVEDTGTIDEQQYIDDRIAVSNTRTDGLVQNAIDTSSPVGTVQVYAGSSTPSGWLFCDGSAVSRTTYAALFFAIGTTYGGGDGSTTFNLPNLTNRFIQGNSTVGTVKNAGLPNITGDFCSDVNGTAWFLFTSSSGSFYLAGGTPGNAMKSTQSGATQGGRRPYINLDASRSSSIYGNSTTVQPPALTMRYVIKY